MATSPPPRGIQPARSTSSGTPPPRGIQPGESLVPKKAGNAVASNQVQPSPTGAGARANVRPQLRKKREKILLLGDTTSGKSYAYMRKAKWELESAHAQGRSPKKFYVIDTDDTLPSFLNEGDEFEDLYYGNGGNVYPYPAHTWEEVRDTYATIRPMLEEGDWLIFDLASRIYDLAIGMVAKIKGMDVSDSTIQRAMDGKGFGAFDGATWNLVTNTFESVIKDALLNTQANVVCLQHITEIIDVAGREGKREQMLLFDAIGLKPQGAPRLAGLVDTIIMIWAIRQITRGEGGKRVNAKTVRTFALLKDRGKDLFLKMDYDRDAFDALTEARRAYNREQSNNIVDTSEADRIRRETTETLHPPDLTQNLDGTTDNTGAD